MVLVPDAHDHPVRVLKDVRPPNGDLKQARKIFLRWREREGKGGREGERQGKNHRRREGRRII